MGLPRTPEARLYYRAAKQRFQEAEVLLKARLKTGAVYLAGYTVERFLKALILEAAAPPLRGRLLAEFRGRRAHDIEWLSSLYRQRVGGNVPREVARSLTQTTTWETHLRYASVVRRQGDADQFLRPSPWSPTGLKGECDMPVAHRTRRPDAILKQLGESLARYAEAHPNAAIEIYRRYNVSVRIRIIDQDFKRKSLLEREEQVWPLFDALPDETVADVTMLPLLTPEEAKESLGSFEFDHPTKSRI